MKATSRCGYVAIVGRPNVGKSTLLNSILGTKVSITSVKPQTTRFQILGIKTRQLSQAVYIDTPGLHQDEKKAMNRYMNKLASAVIPDADIVIFVVEALKWSDDDELVLSKLKAHRELPPVILVINKIDNPGDKKELLPYMDMVKDKFNFSKIIPTSATRLENIEGLQEEIEEYLPEGEHFFSNEQVTDKNIRFQVAEIVREKLMEVTEQEVPYATTVEVEDWQEEEKRTMINVLIWVEREGQKLIIIGRKGERLKRIGIEARKEIEALLKQKVFLGLWVKVKERWTDDERALRQLGYK